jgi:phospho-N-acetylmuramoyl-pentapeptide-transferase
MLILTKSSLAVMISFILSIVFGLVFLPFLKKLHVIQRISEYVKDMHQKKNGTPTMGGLIFIIPTIVTMLVLYVLGKIEFSYNLLIIVFTFISYALVGFIDDYLIIKRKSNKGLTESQNLFFQIIIACFFFF